ncbi:hypothetical protein HID58_038350 [Brassica napus]|uniref:Uncharacterized protein n=1 Tax=Brassica napus TaxID=3708 RepID=A0ABQ8BP18_BRANA|nr:hypothetical protein HID58_038350 [Brassica napus]
MDQLVNCTGDQERRQNRQKPSMIGAHFPFSDSLHRVVNSWAEDRCDHEIASERDKDQSFDEH